MLQNVKDVIHWEMRKNRYEDGDDYFAKFKDFFGVEYEVMVQHVAYGIDHGFAEEMRWEILIERAKSNIVFKEGGFYYLTDALEYARHIVCDGQLITIVNS